LKDFPPRERHFNVVLGDYLANFPLPPLSRAEWQERFAPRETEGAMTGQAMAAAQVAPVVVASTASAPASWRAPAIATVLAAVLL
ncbi:hypothetical protein, partial [Acinetobacter baumannii]|uniref:hypothetical protein n=1 Tax=Acinetobacter baumannii TaxID=470 RepID=UPI0013D44F8E